MALKILPEAFATDPDRLARFQREAQVLASLNHPGIAAIYGIEESGDTRALVLELVEGPTLADRISKGPIPVDEALPIAKQIAEALEAAHEAGVIHRDLKPANIKVREDGTVKVLDFGLAKRAPSEALSQATTETYATMTQAGALLRTLPYMAPEQLRGQPADVRSDIWALGLVLYEMVAGERPFKGKTGVELSSAILHQPPAPLPRSVSVSSRVVIERCLAKEPGQRYQRASEVQAAIADIQAGTALLGVVWSYGLSRRRLFASVTAAAVALAAVVTLNLGGVRDLLLGVGGPAASITLAVFPFENLTGDPEQEYLSDGMTEEMISQLGRLNPERLGVIARTSAMRYKATDKPVDEIGRELGVGYLLEGAVRPEAGRIRINVRLIRVVDQLQVWAESYERELADIMAVQHEVARGVAASLAVALLPGERTRLASSPTVNPEAYEAYLTGLHHFYEETPADFEIALRYFESVLQYDSEYALAHVGIARVWSGRQQHGFAPPNEATPRARTAALRALDLDPNLAEAHMAFATVLTWGEWNWEAAEPAWRRAIELDPNLADARALCSHFLMSMRRPDEAMAQLRRALELDPLNTFNQALYGVALVIVRQYDEAIVQLQDVLRTSPRLPFALFPLSDIYHLNGQQDEALDTARMYLTATGQQESAEALEAGYAAGGYAEAMRRVAETAAASALGVDVATWYMRAGDEALALEWLETGLRQRDPNMPYIGVIPLYDPLGDDPRFQDLLRRMNLPG